ncbi:MAG: VTT domain-containing protein [Chloroflexota bacterium]
MLSASFVPVRYLKSVRAVLIAVGLLGIWGYRVPLWNAILMIGDPQAIVEYLQSFDSYGLLVLSLLMLAQVFLALIPGQALMVASGYLYGASTTIVVVAVTTILGSEIAFWLARRYGRPLIYKLASPKVIDYWDRLAGKAGPGFFFITFLLPVFPSDLMCYVAGLGKVSPRGFFAANVGGRMISAVTFTLLGAYKFNPPLWFWVAVAVGLVVILTSWAIYKRKHLGKTG